MTYDHPRYNALWHFDYASLERQLFDVYQAQIAHHRPLQTAARRKRNGYTSARVDLATNGITHHHGVHVTSSLSPLDFCDRKRGLTASPIQARSYR